MKEHLHELPSEKMIGPWPRKNPPLRPGEPEGSGERYLRSNQKAREDLQQKKQELLTRAANDDEIAKEELRDVNKILNRLDDDLPRSVEADLELNH